ncbi:MAG: S26 family signal peptidase, partial [Anaerolineales bacterium]
PRAYRRQPPSPGDLVVALHPHEPATKIIKRVASVHPDGRVELTGVNLAESTDFRGVASDQILGRATSKFA